MIKRVELKPSATSLIFVVSKWEVETAKKDGDFCDRDCVDVDVLE